jgi:REP element-mobilizing transposase RayT
VDRRYYNRYGEPKIRPDVETRESKARLRKSDPFYLGAAERSVVESAIREVCRVRAYALFALAVRTEHVHIVAGNSGQPERMMDSFKAYATKALRNEGLIGSVTKPWSRHGSTRYLWTDDHIAKAVDYVANGQGVELPEFD